MTKCPDDKHNFKPRYDEGPSEIPAELRFSAFVSAEAFRPKTYVGDICQTCGQWVKRPKPDNDA